MRAIIFQGQTYEAPNWDNSQTKQIAYKGISYNVPQWAKWIAEDFDGWLTAFGERPSYVRGEWCSNGGAATSFAQRDSDKLMKLETP